MAKKTSAYGKRGWRRSLCNRVFHKALQGKSAKSTGTSYENWEEMDGKAASTIQLCLADEVMYNVVDEETAQEYGQG